MNNTLQNEKHGNIAVLRINRPPANAIDLALAIELEEALADIEQDDDAGAMILTATGNCFSAGLDLKVVPTYDRGQQQAMVMAGTDCLAVCTACGFQLSLRSTGTRSRAA